MPSSALPIRSEEHTSELQSHDNLVCRLLLEKKNNKPRGHHHHPVTDPAPSRWRCHRGYTPPTRRVPPDLPPGGRPPVCVRFFFFLNNRRPPKFSLLPHPPPFRS